MTSQELRQKFLNFFSAKGGSASGGKGHTIVPSSSLIPENDPSVLLTTAGMQQFKPYFTGAADPMKDNHLSFGHPLGNKNVASVQKSFRTSDIDEVGDDTHLTFFEMLGHFSFGDYFKKETIAWTYELLTEEFKISPERIRVTVFGGDKSVPFDEESFSVWSKVLPKDKIGKGVRADNFWGPVGSEGPCGACNEVYVDDVEVATLVFVEYYSKVDGSLEKLDQKGVDVGWGFERLIVKLQGLKNVFETDLFTPIMSLLPNDLDERKKRIIADHIRAISFLVSDGLRPSNKEAGYVLRRLMRRIISYGEINFSILIHKVVEVYSIYYSELNEGIINSEFHDEYSKFKKTLARGLRKFNEITETYMNGKLTDRCLSTYAVFDLYQSDGFPFDLIKEKAKERGLDVDEVAFQRMLEGHQKLSRTSSVGTFKGGLVDHEPQTIKHHTAHHLLLAALRQVLGNHVLQRGSNVSSERLRIDFAHPEKVTAEQLKKVEEIVNKAIESDLEVKKEEMPKVEAEKLGALAEFGAKYGDTVSVYTILNKDGSVFSREFCGGPHVNRTEEIGNFKIIKEEAVAAGIRRIKAKSEK